MTDITIENGRAKTNGKPDRRLYSILGRIEGQKRYLQSGAFSFEPTVYNLELWKSTFPDCNIKDNDEETKVFQQYVPKAKRPEFKLLRDQMPHQERAHHKLVDKDAFGLFLVPGGGKSKTLTDNAISKYCRGTIDAMIVVTPNMLVAEQWAIVDDDSPGQLQRDIHPSIKWRSWLWGKTKTALKEYEQFKKFDGFQVIVINIDAVKTKSGKELLYDFIKQHGGRVLFAVDESQLIKNKNSQRFKACSDLGGLCQCRAILSGTPIAKNLLDIWSQFLFLDERIIGIKYKTAFMANYCIVQNNGFADQIIGHKNIEKLYEKIDPYVSRVSQEELGLEKVYDTFEFDMSPEQLVHFNNLKKTFLTQLDNGELLTSANAISAMVRMQQVTNGFLPREDGSIQELPNARLEAFNSWIETIPDDKIMVWCRFKQDVVVLMKSFGDIAVDLSGNVDAQERVVNKNKFIKDANVRFAFGTPDAAGTGMDGLQNVCNRAAYYSNSYNSLLRWQSEDRTLRIGGSTTAFYTDFICRKSPDRNILRNLKQKKDLSNLTLDDIRRMFE